MAWDWNAINVGLNNGINAYHKTAQAIDAYKAREARDEYTKAMEGANRDFARIIFSGNSPRSTPPRRGFSYATASSSQ